MDDSVPSITFEDVAERLTRYDNRLKRYLAEEQTVSTNNVTHYSNTQSCYYKNHTREGGRGYKNRFGNGGVVCQICCKMGHSALNCWHRFDSTFQ
uniref:Retrovirus-related Pol polyprotein from transposon TNT 1-94 n=2 Tax=Noccaea caerulescens TaxID=107243 RepID=A0A1J3HJD7_NOCCA